MGWNEKSFRYTEVIDEDEFYIPKHFRKQSTSNKQGSDGLLDEWGNSSAMEAYTEMCQASYETYKHLLHLGVCREEARAVLAPAVYTSWVWTASLQSVLHFIDLRKGSGAQSQIALYAHAMTPLIKPIVPITIEAWEYHSQKS